MDFEENWQHFKDVSTVFQITDNIFFQLSQYEEQFFF